jgi:hypothetical protein
LQAVNLESANLTRANLTGTGLEGVNLAGTVGLGNAPEEAGEEISPFSPHRFRPGLAT